MGCRPSCAHSQCIVHPWGEAIRGVAYTIVGRFVPVVNVNAPVATRRDVWWGSHFRGQVVWVTREG